MEEGDAGVGGGAVEEGAEAEDVVVGLCPTTYPHSATPPNWPVLRPSSSFHFFGLVTRMSLKYAS